MNNATFVITGTDTDIGKTVFAAALTAALGAYYWKPVQAGLEDGNDSERVAQYGGISPARVLPEAYRLTTPCSPHRAAELDGVEIDPERLRIPDIDGALVIEGAGGALVPINPQLLYADQFARWQLPVIIVARTQLGTINHSLMTAESLRARSVPIHGIAFVGTAQEESERTICDFTGLRRLGRLPMLGALTPENLRTAFYRNFDLQDFTI